MIIKNKDLKKLLKEKTKKEVLYMYIHRIINMTNKQLDYVMSYEE